ncbi:MAG: hypothetical protein U5O39_14050 [Gammaproteobacteria bacterium]|nr:hypothetical protein [Gammaproteobacteria bacterium]
MDEDLMDYDDRVGNVEIDYDTRMGLQRHDVRRKIEEILERKRLREEFGDLEY